MVWVLSLGLWLVQSFCRLYHIIRPRRYVLGDATLLGLLCQVQLQRVLLNMSLLCELRLLQLLLLQLQCLLVFHFPGRPLLGQGSVVERFNTIEGREAGLQLMLEALPRHWGVGRSNVSHDCAGWGPANSGTGPIFERATSAVGWSTQTKERPRRVAEDSSPRSCCCSCSDAHGACLSAVCFGYGACYGFGCGYGSAPFF